MVAAHALRAEALGFDGLNIPEAVHDGFVGATLALAATTRIRVATSVAVAFPRSPMAVAIAAWDLAALSGSRFELGLGSQVRGNIEGRYATAWTSPVPRMREYVLALRQIFSAFQTGSDLSFSGESYRFDRLQPFFRPDPLDEFSLPIHLGGVGPKMTALAAEVADGLITHPTNTAPRYLREILLPRLAEVAGIESKGPYAEVLRQTGFRLIVGCRVATGRNAMAVNRDREKARKTLAFLYSTPAYWPSLEIFGWQNRGEQLLEMSRMGRWQDMADVVSDEMLDAFVPSAPYEGIADLLRTRYEGLTDTLTLPMPENPEDDALMGQVIANLQGKNPSSI